MDGRSEIGLAAITITLVDVVVYVPMAVMTTGLPAQFLQPFAVVITFATLTSLLVSFTLTPAGPLLLAAFGAPRGHTPASALWSVWDAGFARLERGYERLSAGRFRAAGG